MKKLQLYFHYFFVLVSSDDDSSSACRNTKEKRHRQKIIEFLRQFRRNENSIFVNDDYEDEYCGRMAKEATLNRESALVNVCGDEKNEPYIGMALEVFNVDDCKDFDEISVLKKGSFNSDIMITYYELLQPLVPELGTVPKHPFDYAYTPALTEKENSQILLKTTPSKWWLWWFVFMSSKFNENYSNDDRYKAEYSFAGGSHGEVWRGRRQCQPNEACDNKKNNLILKRLKVEQGINLLEAGLREIYFGNILGKTNLHGKHFTLYVDHFFRKIPGQSFLELWIVFEDAGSSLRSLIYEAKTSNGGFIIFQHSNFWRKIRMLSKFRETSESRKNEKLIEIGGAFIKKKPQQQTGNDPTVGRQILREVLRQILESAARLGESGIVHRDIKPSNVMCTCKIDLEDLLDTDNPDISTINCVLGDLSSAWDSFSDQNLYSNGPSKEEQTKEYSPPEALIGNPWIPFHPEKPESYDSWSIGVLALEMLLGTPDVFSVDQRTTVLLTHLMEKNGASHEDIQRALYLAALSQFCIFSPSVSNNGDPINWPLRRGDPLHKTSMVKQSCTINDFHQALRARDPLGVGFDSSIDSLLHLIWNLLAWNPMERMSPSEALQHPFFTTATTADKALESLMLDPRMDMKSTDTVDEFICPKCGRVFRDWHSCHIHTNSRRHGKFCKYDRSRLPFCLNAHTLLPEHTFSGYCDIQGRRRTIEDFHAIQLHPDHHFYGVFDGHTGNLAPKFAASMFYGMLQRRFSNISAESKYISTWKDDTVTKMTGIFEEIHKQFLEAASLMPIGVMDQSGTTATIIYINKHVALVASVGDSRAVLSSKGKNGKISYVQLTEDHIASNEKERDLVHQRGGTVTKAGGIARVNGILAITRSIGDSALSKYLSREPSVVAMTRLEIYESCGLDRCFVVLASDGLWDVMTNEEVINMVNEILEHFDSTKTRSWRDGGAFQEAAERLTQEAYVRGSKDNIGVCVVAID